MTALAYKVLTPPQHLLTRPTSKFMYKSISNAFHKMKLQKATVTASFTKALSLQYCWTRYRKYYDAPFINYNFNIIRYKYKVDCL